LEPDDLRGYVVRRCWVGGWEVDKVIVLIVSCFAGTHKAA
jgi:hypothetical protein